MQYFQALIHIESQGLRYPILCCQFKFLGLRRLKRGTRKETIHPNKEEEDVAGGRGLSGIVSRWIYLPYLNVMTGRDVIATNPSQIMRIGCWQTGHLPPPSSVKVDGLESRDLTRGSKSGS